MRDEAAAREPRGRRRLGVRRSRVRARSREHARYQGARVDGELVREEPGLEWEVPMDDSIPGEDVVKTSLPQPQRSAEGTSSLQTHVIPSLSINGKHGDSESHVSTQPAPAPVPSRERTSSPMIEAIHPPQPLDGEENPSSLTSIDHEGTTQAIAGTDSELDGDGEVDADADDDLDAEGEDEDDRESIGHVAISSSDIRDMLQASTRLDVSLADDEDDVDAEGEVEEDLDEQPATAFLGQLTMS